MSEQVTTLVNGLRVVTIRMPHVDSVAVGVFVRTGSRNETEKMNGISHFLEHMAFKGTETRSCRDIAVGVERLGAMMNAYTSKDTTAYYMSGLAKHANVFVEMLADMIQNNTFPEEELEREREVIIQEFNQYQDDADSLAGELIDAVAFGDHSPLGQTILGPIKNIKRFTREDLQTYIKSQYTAPNIVVGIVGNIDHHSMVTLVERFFSGLPQGEINAVEVPTYQGGIKIKKKAAFTQSTLMMGWPTENLCGDYYVDLVASSLVGDGFSSPLFTEIREVRGLAYHISTQSHIMDNLGQFYVHAGTTSEHLDACFSSTCEVLKRLATKVDPIDLERAINTINVISIKKQERGFSRIQSAAEDLFTYGAIIDPRDFMQQVESVTGDQVQNSIARMMKAMPSIAVVGKGADPRFLQLVLDTLK